MPFALPAMKAKVRRAYQLADGQPVEVKLEAGRTLLSIARPIVDPMATVVVLELEGEHVLPRRSRAEVTGVTDMQAVRQLW